MQIRLSITLTLLSCVLSIACQRERELSYYDLPNSVENRIVFLDLSRYSNASVSDLKTATEVWDVMHVAATLQGIVNREEPHLFIKYVTDGDIDVDQYWWDKFITGGRWLGDKSPLVIFDPVDAVTLFKDKVNGLVVYDPDMAATSNLASTIAGVEDLVAVRYDTAPGSLYSRLLKSGQETKVSLLKEDGSSMFSSKTEAYQWAVDNYLKTGKCSAETAAYYIDQYWRTCAGNNVTNHHLLLNHDYFVSRKAFFFDLSPWNDEAATDTPDEAAGADYEMLKQILSELYRLNGGDIFCHIGGFPSWPFKYTDFYGGGKHGPVETEWKFVQIISDYNAFLDADGASYGALANASFWQHYPLKEKYPQKWVSKDDLKAKGYLTADGKVDRSKKYCMIYVGDYDGAAWVYQSTPSIWDDPARGDLPLTWAISPVMERRVPMAMDYLRESATENDYFIASDNGAGYLCPESLEEPRLISGLPSGLEAWKRHCARYYERWDITVSGFLINSTTRQISDDVFRCYSEFSPNGACPLFSTKLTQMVNGMPVLLAGPDIASGDSAEAASFVASRLADHPGTPFYWFRTILRSPSWHLELKNGIENIDKNAVWVSGPEFFELLRCYLQENEK